MNRNYSALLFFCLALTGCVRAPHQTTNLDASNDAHKVFQQAVAEAKKVGLPMDVRGFQAPLPPESQNAATYYRQAMQLLHNKPFTQEETAGVDVVKLGSPFSETKSEAARRVLADRADLLRLTHRAARRERCVFIRNWNSSDPARILFPEFATMRQCMRLLAAESLLMAYDGKPLEAVRNLAEGFQIARHAASEPILISYLVGVAVDAITLRGMQIVLYMAGDRPEVAEAIAKTVEKSWQPLSLVPALRGEVGFQMQLIEMLRKEGPSGLAALQATTSGEETPPRPDHLPTANPRAWNAIVDANGLLMLGNMRKMIAVADHPFPEADPVVRAANQAATQGKDSSTALSAIIMPTFSEIVAKRAQIEAMADVTRASAAVLAYRGRHGEFPRTLAEVLSPVPTDAFDGKPLRYRQEGAGFVVYSVGRDSTFDGGTPNQKPDKSAVLFRYPRPAYADQP